MNREEIISPQTIRANSPTTLSTLYFPSLHHHALQSFNVLIQIDVSGGDKIPRKGGPGITQSDLLIVNKTDLAEIVGADLAVMERDAAKMRYKSFCETNVYYREGGPTLFAQIKNGVGVEDIVRLILSAWRASGAAEGQT